MIDWGVVSNGSYYLMKCSIFEYCLARIPSDDVIIDMFSRHSRPSNPPSSYSHSSSSGPIIREISEEEAEQSIPKRRKDLYGR